jgi:hypothetical protein
VPVAKYLPLLVGVILAIAVVATAITYVPQPVSKGNVTLRVGYPDSLDQSDVSDLYAYANILPAEGITVIPTFYDAPFLSYQGLQAGQQDIALVSGNSFFSGVAQGAQTTFVSCYSLGGTFMMIAGHGITKPSQLTGGAVDDFGSGSETRALNIYWLSQANVPTNAVGLQSGSVYVRPSGPNPARVVDLEKGTGNVSAITVDDFILHELSGTANTTANGGPFHVLFTSPNNVVGVCYAVKDSWLSNPANQAALVSFIAAITQSQRDFITDPSLMVSYATSQLPLTGVAQLQFASTFYPQQMTYWPYGAYNLQGPLTIQNVLANSNTFYKVTGAINASMSNSTVTPFGIINKWFEWKALQQIGPYTYPCHAWVTASFANQVNSVVPSSLGSAPTNCPATAASQSSQGGQPVSLLILGCLVAIPGVRLLRKAPA